MKNNIITYNDILYHDKCPFCIMGRHHKYIIWQIVKDMSKKELQNLLNDRKWIKQINKNKK